MRSGRVLVERWNRFWLEEGPTFGIGLFRVLFAYCLWREIETTHSKSTMALEGGGFHLPYLDIIPLMSESTYQWLHSLEYVFVALLALGLFHRISCGALVALQGWVFFADQLNFRNHPYIFVLITFLLMFSHADEAVTLKHWLRRLVLERRWSLEGFWGPKRPLTLQRLIQLQVCISYFYAGVHKINSGFLKGEVLGDNLRDTVKDWGGLFETVLGTRISEWLQELLISEPSLIGAAVATLLLELLLPVFLWVRRYRTAAMIVGIGFHLFIATLMNIRTFSAAMIGSYLLFLDPETALRHRYKLIAAAVIGVLYLHVIEML